MKFLAALVGRVRLAGEDELHRAFRVRQDARQTVGVAEDQGGPLVGGEAPGEADREWLWLQERSGRHHLPRVDLAGGPAPPAVLMEVGEQVLVVPLANGPEFLVRDVQDWRPDVFVLHALLPIGGEIPVEQLLHGRRNPGREVDAIGDGGDRGQRRLDVGPDVVPHGAGDLAVAGADAVAVTGEAHGERGHVEAVAAGVVVPQFEKCFAGQTEPGPKETEVAIHEVGRKDIVAGRDRGVGGEDGGRDDALGGLLEIEPIRDPLANALQQVEPRVALVAVPVDGVDPHGAQSAHAADTEDLLLAQSVLLVAAVQARRDGAGPLRVAFDIGIEQIERDPADPHAPDLNANRRVGIVQGDLDAERLAVVPSHQCRRLRARFQRGGDIELPAVVAEALAQVPLTVEEGDADQRQPQVAGRLGVVAGQHAQSAGVDRQRGVDTELSGEVRDRAPDQLRLMLANPGGGRVGTEERAELRHDPVVAILVGGIGSGVPQPFWRHIAQKEDRVFFDRGEQKRVQVAVKVFGVRLPAPPEVLGERTKSADAIRQRRRSRIVGVNHSMQALACPAWRAHSSPMCAFRRVESLSGYYAGSDTYVLRRSWSVSIAFRRYFVPTGTCDRSADAGPRSRARRRWAIASFAARSPEAMQSGSPTPR